MSSIFLQMIPKSLLIAVFVILQFPIHAQTSSRKHEIYFKPQFFQIKDEFNYGLVFNGLNLCIGYSLTSTSERATIIYSPQLAFGVNYNHGIGMAWHFRPVDIYYGIHLKTGSIKLGPYLSTNYQWQLYPELQSGHMYWFSSFELGPRLLMELPVGQKIFNIHFTNSFLGIVSRPEPQPAGEVYFYSLAAKDWVGNVHKDLTIGFNNLFNHTIIRIEVPSDKRMTLGYEFEYFGYYDNPGIKYIVHSVNLKWKLGK